MKKIFSFLIASLVFITITFAKSNSDVTIISSKTQPKMIKNVLIFGNSIVAHQVAPAIGWNGDWGMAASVRDSDFVHLLIADIQNIDKSVNVRFLNISAFENYYDTYDLSQLADYRNADMIIVKISENVKSETAEKREFISHYKSLLNYLAPSDSTVRIIVEGFWPSPVNTLIKDYALKENYTFVAISDLYTNDSGNSAKGLFKNEGVANHPSDKGMRNIAIRIWDKISKYFL